MTITTQRIITNGVSLDVHQSGPEDGELVILLHGFPEHGMAWKAQIEHLAAQGYRVWAPDQRGYAGSDKPAGAMSYQTHILALDAIGLADAAGAQTFTLVGHACWGDGACSAPEYPTRPYLRSSHANPAHPPGG